jgi:hypothetical protein
MRQIPIASGEQRDCLTGKSVSLPIPCPAPATKIFRFSLHPNQIYIPRRPASTEGRFAIVTDVRRDAVDADGAGDVGA